MSKVHDLLVALIEVESKKGLAMNVKYAALGKIKQEIGTVDTTVLGMLGAMSAAKVLDWVDANENKTVMDEKLIPALIQAMKESETVQAAIKAIKDARTLTNLAYKWDFVNGTESAEPFDKTAHINMEDRAIRSSLTMWLRNPQGEIKPYDSAQQIVDEEHVPHTKGINARISVARAYASGKVLSGWRRVNEDGTVIMTDEVASVRQQACNKDGTYKYSDLEPAAPKKTTRRAKTA